MTRKIILFGAGGGGKNTLGALKRSVKVIAVSDNDTRKHGTLFCGIPVIAPGEIATREYDLVLIASVYAPEIHAQLLALGIPRDKIEIADERRLVNSASFPWDALIFLALAGLLVTGLVGGLIAWMF